MLPSNASDLIHLLISRCISLAAAVRFEECRDLLHQISVLKNLQGFLFSLPVLSTHNHESLSGPARHLEGFVPANNLFDRAF